MIINEDLEDWSCIEWMRSFRFSTVEGFFWARGIKRYKESQCVYLERPELGVAGCKLQTAHTAPYLIILKRHLNAVDSVINEPLAQHWGMGRNHWTSNPWFNTQSDQMCGLAKPPFWAASHPEKLTDPSHWPKGVGRWWSSDNFDSNFHIRTSRSAQHWSHWVGAH